MELSGDIEMSADEEKRLFELTAGELEDRLSEIFAPYATTRPIQSEVAASLLAALAATQRLALQVFEQACTYGGDADARNGALGQVFEDVEAFNEFLLKGSTPRLDLVQWDSLGYIHGWFVDRHGRRDPLLGSCPEVVARLAMALHELAPHVQGWGEPLERRSTSLKSLIRCAREKAELNARAKVESQSWFRKLVFPVSLQRELRFLGFR